MQDVRLHQMWLNLILFYFLHIFSQYELYSSLLGMQIISEDNPQYILFILAYEGVFFSKSIVI